MEQWDVFISDPSLVSVKCYPDSLTRAEIEISEDEDIYEDFSGENRHQNYLLKAKVPYFLSYVMSNRSTMTTYYRRTLDDGTETMFHSSRGNENLCRINADKIGDDVVTNNVLCYFAYKPYEGGMELTHILKADPSGSIPEYLKQRAATRATKSLQTVVNFCRDGTIPEPLF